MTVERVRDLIVAVFVLGALAPLLFLCSIAVRLTSSGPVLFRQKRLGQYGRSFELLKFRTMYDGAPDLRNEDGSAVAEKGDPRVTSIGRFLRRSSLDEMPQLINVFRGEMSLVGPRPDQVDQEVFYTVTERRKLLVKPGITGLAQISGRNSISWARRKALDVEYVDRQSFWLDLTILARTIPYVLLGKDTTSNDSSSNSRAGASN